MSIQLTLKLYQKQFLNHVPIMSIQLTLKFYQKAIPEPCADHVNPANPEFISKAISEPCADHVNLANPEILSKAISEPIVSCSFSSESSHYPDSKELSVNNDLGKQRSGKQRSVNLLEVKKSPYKIKAIPQLPIYTPELTKQVLHSFSMHVKSADGGGLKHCEQYSSHVGKIIDVVGGLEYLTAENIVIQYLTPHMDNTAQNKESTSTVKVRLYALAHFCSFIEFIDF